MMQKMHALFAFGNIVGNGCVDTYVSACATFTPYPSRKSPPLGAGTTNARSVP